MIEEKENASKMLGDQEVIWLSDLHSLTDIVDNFPLPVLVKVVDGYMLTEEDCLESETILTIHGQHTTEKILASDNSGKELNIPLDCKYKLRVSPSSGHCVYNTIKDVCEAPYLPTCLENKTEFKDHWVSYPVSTLFDVQHVIKGKRNEIKGLSVIAQCPKTVTSTTFPLKVRGDFVSVPRQCDRTRSYVVEDLINRKFPIFVEFLPTQEKRPTYGPRLGKVHLKSVYKSTIIYATNYVKDKRFLVTFSRDLIVQLQIGRVMVQEADECYSTIAEPNEAPVDQQVLSYMINSDPYLGDYSTALYSELQGSMVPSATRNEVPDDSKRPAVPKRSSTRCQSTTEAAEGRRPVPTPVLDSRTETDNNAFPHEPTRPSQPKEICPYQEMGIQSSTDYSYAKIDKTVVNAGSKEYYTTIADKVTKNRYTPEPVAPKLGPRIKKVPTRSSSLTGCMGQNQKIPPAVPPKPPQEKVSQANVDVTECLMTALAFSLPLDDAANLQYKPDESKGNSDATRELNITADKDKKQGESYDTVLEVIRQQGEEGICGILDLIHLSQFAESFREQQINGELLKDLEEHDLIDDLKMSAFQARKLLLYIRGWKPDAERTPTAATETDVLGNWTTEAVCEKLQLIKMPMLATFCLENQVNGSLLSKIVDEEMLQSIREYYNIKLSKIEEKKLRKFVVSGWRPTSKT